MLIENPRGNYSFVRGIAPYSGGAVASAGYEVVHARFAQPVALRRGFAEAKAHIEASGRPIAALCGMELRSPKPFTFQGFNDFNAGYVDVLRDWGILLDSVNPVARTNIAPEIGAPAEPSLYGFSFTRPATGSARTFVVAGAGELPEGSLDPHDVVRRGETSADALRAKIRFVMGLMKGRMTQMGVTWNDATVTEIYTVHPICQFVAAEITRPMERGAVHGMTWHYSRPPIVSIEYEMDVRGCRTEVVLPG